MNSLKNNFSFFFFPLCFFALIIFSCNNTQPQPLVQNTNGRNVIDTNPPVTPLSPEESMKKIQLPDGYQIELVASEPMVQEPVAIAWDGNGRMYVAEMNTYMEDAAATGEFKPTSRIKLLEDTNGDGKMDKSSIFVDSLVLPRSILCVGDELLVNITNDQSLYSYRDTNGDGKADVTRIVFKNNVPDVRNLEHQNGGLLWNLDNWIYPTRDNVRYKYVNGMLLADTMVDNMIGQWGITTNNYGRLFYSEAGPGLPAVQIQQMPAYGALNFNDQYSEDFTKPWPIIGTLDAQGGRDALRPDNNTLKKFTSGCGQSIFRGDRLPADMLGDYFIPEPVGRIIKRGKIVNKESKIYIKDAYEEKDWLASADMNFRPINTYTGPDGCFYIVDMYHGIIQESEWTKPDSYLGKIIAQKELYKNKGMGRIYRVVHTGIARDTTRPNMLNETASQLIKHLDHPNGWWRDNAQQLMIVRNDTTIVPDLKRIAGGQTGPLKRSPSALARIHAIWTLEGMGVLDKPTILTAIKDQDPQVRRTAIWAAEKFIKQNDLAFIDQLASLKNDKDANVKLQLYLSLRSNKTPKAQAMVKEILAANTANEMMQYSDTVFLVAQQTKADELKRTLNLSAADRKLVNHGQVIFKQLCATCHGPDGKGITMGGSEMPAPPLAGSPRVKGDKILLTQLIFYGLHGPVDGKKYKDMMPAMGHNDDEWLASVISYIRNSGELGNNASVMTTGEVKTIRANSPKEMKGGMDMQTLEIFKLGRAEKTNWGKKTGK